MVLGSLSTLDAAESSQSREMANINYLSLGGRFMYYLLVRRVGLTASAFVVLVPTFGEKKIAGDSLAADLDTVWWDPR